MPPKITTERPAEIHADVPSRDHLIPIRLYKNKELQDALGDSRAKVGEGVNLDAHENMLTRIAKKLRPNG